jgi:sec-independent protein translocase protein TatC
LGAPLYYTSPAGSFNFALKVAYVLGIFIALPVIVFQLIKFIEPALPIRIKNGFVVKVIVASFLLAVMGSSFGFFIIIPTSLHFFMGYSTTVIKPLISATEYLTFVINIIITFALLFQIPLVVLFINYVKPLKPKDLLRFQKHIIIAAFVLSVILPFTYDPITQFVMALPIVFLYYFSIVLIWFVNRKAVPSVVLKPLPTFSASDLIENGSSPILDMQGIPPTIEPQQAAFIPNTAVALATVPTGRSLDGMMGSKRRMMQKSSPIVSTYEPITTFTYKTDLKKPVSVDGFVRSKLPITKKVVSTNLIDANPRPEKVSEEVSEEVSPAQTPQLNDKKAKGLIDGFLPTSSIKKIAPQIKLDDIYPYSVS